MATAVVGSGDCWPLQGDVSEKLPTILVSVMLFIQEMGKIDILLSAKRHDV